MKINKNKWANTRFAPTVYKAFTLVELIVVITILAILGTIAFISLQGYSRDARDSTRTSDLGNMKTSLELYSLKTGNYPKPDNFSTITYSGGAVWYQGVVGDQVTTNLKSLNEKPLDPLTKSPYTYSVTQSKGEYEVLALYEGSVAYNQSSHPNPLPRGEGVSSIFPQANAATTTLTPKVVGNYNGVYVTTTNYIIPTPSIITAEPGGIILDGTNIRSQVITNGTNIPNNTLTPTKTGALTGFNLVVFTGSITKNSTEAKKVEAITQIQNAYTGAIALNTQENIAYILNQTSTGQIVALIDITLLKGHSSSTSVINNTPTPPAITCPTGFIPVPGNTNFSQPAFCVAKYEMTYSDANTPNSSAPGDWNTVSYILAKVPVSMSGKYPIADITQPQAILSCQSMGAGYHLITNNEWMTIARNIEQQSVNWNGGVVGTNFLFNGVSNGTSGCNIDLRSTTGRIGATTTGDSSCTGQRNKLTLSNQEQIWDLAGNVWEHVNKANTVDGTNYNSGQTSVAGSSNGVAWDDNGIYSQSDMNKYGSILGYGTAKGMGNLYYADGVGSNNFVRGGNAQDGSNAGVFALYLLLNAGSANRLIGFRCAR